MRPWRAAGRGCSPAPSCPRGWAGGLGVLVPGRGRQRDQPSPATRSASGPSPVTVWLPGPRERGVLMCQVLRTGACWEASSAPRCCHGQLCHKCWPGETASRRKKEVKRGGKQKSKGTWCADPPMNPCFWVLCDTSLRSRWAKAWKNSPSHGCTILLGAGGRAVGWGMCHGKGRAAGVMLWEGVLWSGPPPGAQVLQHNQRPGWLCPGWAGSPKGRGAPWGPLSHPTPHLPLPPRKRTLFPVEVPRRRSLFRWETSPSPPSALQKKKNPKPREERNNKQIPSLSWLGICSQSFHY